MLMCELNTRTSVRSHWLCFMRNCFHFGEIMEKTCVRLCICAEYDWFKGGAIAYAVGILF